MNTFSWRNMYLYIHTHQSNINWCYCDFILLISRPHRGWSLNYTTQLLLLHKLHGWRLWSVRCLHVLHRMTSSRWPSHKCTHARAYSNHSSATSCTFRKEKEIFFYNLDYWAKMSLQYNFSHHKSHRNSSIERSPRQAGNFKTSWG